MNLMFGLDEKIGLLLPGVIHNTYCFDELSSCGFASLREIVLASAVEFEVTGESPAKAQRRKV